VSRSTEQLLRTHHRSLATGAKVNEKKIWVVGIEPSVPVYVRQAGARSTFDRNICCLRYRRYKQLSGVVQGLIACRSYLTLILTFDSIRSPLVELSRPCCIFNTLLSEMLVRCFLSTAVKSRFPFRQSSSEHCTTSTTTQHLGKSGLIGPRSLGLVIGQEPPQGRVYALRGRSACMHRLCPAGSAGLPAQLVFRYKFTKENDRPIEYDPMFQLNTA